MPAAQTDRPMLALIVRLGGIGFIALMAALIKLAAERGVHLAEIVFWRNFVSVPILLAWVLGASGIGALATARPWAHVTRGAYGMVGMVCNFLAVTLLPLAEAATFNLSAPIFAVILAIVMLKEKVGFWRGSAVAIGFAGIVVIAQPGGGHIPLGGAMAALGGAFMIALISIQIRDLSRTEKPLTIVFWFSVFGSLCAAPWLPFVATTHATGDWWLLLAIGISGTLGQLMITAALRFGNVASVIAMDYSSIIYAALLGWIIFDRFPPTSTWAGVPLVVGAGLVIAWRERRNAARRFAGPRQATGT